MSVLDAFAGFLTTHGVVASSAVLVKGRLPEQPDSLVAVTDYGGMAPEVVHSGGVRRFQRFQVIVRDPDPRVARDVAESAFGVCLATRAWDQTQLLVDGVQWEGVFPLAEPFPLGADSSGRTSIACNYEIRLEG